MLRLRLFAATALAALAFSSCAQFSENTSYSGENPTGHGPFASNGDYREDLADSPDKWKPSIFSKSKAPLPIPEDEQAKIVGNDHPPEQLSPVSSPSPEATPQVDNEVAIVRPSATRPADKSSKVASANSTPKTSSKTSSKTSNSTVKPSTTKPTITAAKPKSKSTSNTTAKDSASAKGPKRIVVKKGDTLYDLAIAHKSTVAAIQKANGISGSNLRIGQTLVIPRY